MKQIMGAWEIDLKKPLVDMFLWNPKPFSQIKKKYKILL